MNYVNPNAAPSAEPVVAEPAVHPLMDRALTSALAWAGAGSVAGLVGLSAVMGALRRSWEEVLTADLFLVGALFLMVASYFAFQLLRLNAGALAMVVVAVLEVVMRRSLARRAEAEARLSLAPAPASERVVTEFVATNKPFNAAVTAVGKTEVWNEDIVTFLWRAWESNGQPKRGLTREHWVGSAKTAGAQGVAAFVFQRKDGSSQECSREYFEALIEIVDKRLHLVEGRKSGNEGKLRESPERVLTQLRWV